MRLSDSVPLASFATVEAMAEVEGIVGGAQNLRTKGFISEKLGTGIPNADMRSIPHFCAGISAGAVRWTDLLLKFVLAILIREASCFCCSNFRSLSSSAVMRAARFLARFRANVLP